MARMDRKQRSNEAFETHYLRETSGIPGPVPASQRLNVGKAVLAVAGADGELSRKEWDAFVQIQRGYGASSDMIEEWEDFDYRRANLNRILGAGTKPFARVILFDALRVARADKVGPKEHRAAQRMAKKLGVNAEIVGTLEHLLDADKALHGARMRLLGEM